MTKTDIDYETKIQYNPIELLKPIKILIHKPEWSKYTFASITEAFKHVVNMKQKDNKSLLDYSKHLKQGKEIFEVHVNKDILGHYVDNLNELKNSTGAEKRKN